MSVQGSFQIEPAREQKDHKARNREQRGASAPFALGKVWQRHEGEVGAPRRTGTDRRAHERGNQRTRLQIKARSYLRV